MQGQQTGRQLTSKLKYSQEIKGETEVDILSSFSLSPGVFYILMVMEGDEITEAIILVSDIIRRVGLRKKQVKKKQVSIKNKKAKCKQNTKSAEGED